ncbi:MAG TPA: energy transducer TonB [Vicinamibacterales bacterium]|nr:energy transducer TonB [Vicinamibacterales bacterium]
MPAHSLGFASQSAATVAAHAVVALAIAAAVTHSVPVVDGRPVAGTAEERPVELQHIVFIARELPDIGGGGGGGGNRQAAPIRRAEGIGSDAITLRVKRQPTAPAAVATPTSAAEDAAPLPSPPVPFGELPSVLLDALPLASGSIEQIGLPNGGVASGTSTGAGSGGGVGTGVGTGIGPGAGPGVGPGTGGGIGGGAYRPGGAVTAPRIITDVKPKYTGDALQKKIEGSVMLELVVNRDGRPSQIRVIRSLDRDGLDQQAVAAVGQWRFEPGRLAGAPVDVLVTVLVDFRIR